MIQIKNQKIKDKRVICFGGGGSIGSELVRQLCVDNRILIYDNNETATFNLVEELKQKGFDVSGQLGDVRDKETVDLAFESFLPQYVFVASAYKHVTPNEYNPMEAVSVNINGTYNIMRSAVRRGIEKFVFISTDKVVNAENIMGLTKKIAEKMVKNAGGVSVRFGNVMASRGSVLEIWQRQMDKGEPLTVTDERMERFMMTIPEAVALVIQAAEIGEPGQILIMDMGQRINILQLAKEILKKSGKDNEIKMIGMKPGETLTETLMTDDEQKKAIKKDNFWIIV